MAKENEVVRAEVNCRNATDWKRGRKTLKHVLFNLSGAELRKRLMERGFFKSGLIPCRGDSWMG